MGEQAKTKPIVLAIAGSDPTGGAGSQADMEAVKALGGEGLYAITAITAQNEKSVLNRRR